jgi:hypothetical protein
LWLMFLRPPYGFIGSGAWNQRYDAERVVHKVRNT